MNILTFHRDLQLEFRQGDGTVKSQLFQAGRPYVFGRPQLRAASGIGEFQGSMLKSSLLEPRIQNFVAQKSGNGESVLVYNGSGGIGDQMMTWPLTVVLHNLGYRVHVLADPGREDCWNFSWIQAIHTLPTEIQLIQLYRHHALFDVVVNTDEHLPQLHPVDSLLFKVGIDPTTVDNQLKRIPPQFSADDVARAKTFAKEALGSRPFAIYQPAASSRIRSLSIDASIALLFRLAKEFPNLDWLAVHDLRQTDVRRVLDAPDRPLNVHSASLSNIRVLWALTAMSKVVVAPDSMMVHAAGCLNVPCVGLWGPTGPEYRVKYYNQHYPLFNPSVCTMAPCHSYTATFPRYCPPLGVPRSECSVLTAITERSVIDAVKTACDNDQRNSRIPSS